MPQMFKKLLTTVIISGITLATPGHAEDRALLIGVGKYQSPEITTLPGIDLDIGKMEKAAKLMRFDSVKTVLDSNATLDNVTNIMEKFLINGVNSTDRVLIYFSGHGTQIPDQNGDETGDKVDEVLTMYDTQKAKIGGQDSLTGVLVDDKFNEILNKIPSQNILVLLDACNSGTATKNISFGSGVLGEEIKSVSKYYQYSGMPTVSKGNFMAKQNIQDNANYVALSAAGDTESAQATTKGSLFTLGILSAIEKAKHEKSALTAVFLKSHATRFIKVNNNQNPFTPNLSGNQKLANKVIKIRESSSSNNYGNKWKRLVQLTEKAQPLDIKINQTDYAIGEHLIITINNIQSGYLNVINIDSDDQPTILFPNKFNPDAKVQGSLVIPTAQMKFNLPAQAPIGPSLIVAFFSDKKINLYNAGKVNIDEIFSTLSESGLNSLTRSFSPEAKKTGYKAGKIITRICESTCN